MRRILTIVIDGIGDWPVDSGMEIVAVPLARFAARYPQPQPVPGSETMEYGPYFNVVAIDPAGFDGSGVEMWMKRLSSS